MPITDNQAIQSILNPVNGAALKRAGEDNDRQRYHVGPATDEKDAGPYASRLKERVKKILQNEDKFKRFCSLLNYPLPSSRLIDNAADEYLKCFGAEDKYVDFEFSSDELKAQASEFLDEIRFDDWLTKDLFNQCLRASAAIWIVDLPATVNPTGFPQPVIMLREVNQLTDLFTDTRGNVMAVIYPMSPIKDTNNTVIAKRWAVLDDASYRVCIQRNGENEPSVLLTNLHDLERCPAGWIWHDKLNGKDPFRIQSPLHAVFTDLDNLVIGDIFRQHVDLYASFPILWNFKKKCNYETPDGLSQCKEGKIWVATKDHDGLEVRIEKPCPVCSASKPLGPGSQLQVPPPADSLSANLSEPAGFINADRDLLDYNVEKLEALKADLREALTGDSNNVDQTKDAVNADQVAARFEARKAKLSYWAAHIQQTHAEALYVILKITFGSSFLSLAVDYGTEFHLISPAQAIDDYQKARTANLPMYQLALRRKRIDKLLAGASETQMTRLEMCAMLEPYPDLPLAMVPVGSDAYELKANFDQYLTQFENENLGLEIFGRDLDMAIRISTIKSILYKYVSESAKFRQLPEPAPGSNPTG